MAVWKQLNEMTTQEFIRWLPEKYLSLFSAVALSLMAATPVLVSLFPGTCGVFRGHHNRCGHKSAVHSCNWFPVVSDAIKPWLLSSLERDLGNRKAL